LGEFFLNILNGSFFMILNIHLANQGFSDPDIAGFTAWQYFSVLIAGIPFGLHIRRRSIQPILRGVALAYPLFAGLLIAFANPVYHLLLPVFFVGMGLSISFLRMMAIPYILRTTDVKFHTHAIALNEISSSGGTLAAGIMISLIDFIFPADDSSIMAMLAFVVLALLSFIVFSFIEKDKSHLTSNEENPTSSINWGKLGFALLPTLFIAVGAGLTIPFLNLFFHHVFGLGHLAFSRISAVSSLLVVIASISVPYWKERMGFEVASISHLVAILALIGLACSELLLPSAMALSLAIFFFIIRQPFMVMAGPLTTQVAMYYVGKNNQEMMSALHSLIWSGSWFFSSVLFKEMRNRGMPFYSIMFVTVGLYLAGTSLFALLIRRYKYREQANFNTE